MPYIVGDILDVALAQTRQADQMEQEPLRRHRLAEGFEADEVDALLFTHILTALQRFCGGDEIVEDFPFTADADLNLLWLS